MVSAWPGCVVCCSEHAPFLVARSRSLAVHSAEPLFPLMASIYLSVFALASQCSPSPTSEHQHQLGPTPYP